jgi:6-pyruvoyltetrahydropterin/6-carboxytetrahydropterin synthase
MSSWNVLIERGNLGFSAAHFITFGGECERLHGHNYGVRVEVTGPLTSDSYVLDFTLLKQVTRTICQEWDHRFLMPLHNPHLRVSERDGSWEIELTYQPNASDQSVSAMPARYVMPTWTVLPLPIDNVTAERLAELLAQRVIAELRRRGVGAHLTSITAGVFETEMQGAFCTLDLTSDPAPPDMASSGGPG